MLVWYEGWFSSVRIGIWHCLLLMLVEDQYWGWWCLIFWEVPVTLFPSVLFMDGCLNPSCLQIRLIKPSMVSELQLSEVKCFVKKRNVKFWTVLHLSPLIHCTLMPPYELSLSLYSNIAACRNNQYQCIHALPNMVLSVPSGARLFDFQSSLLYPSFQRFPWNSMDITRICLVFQVFQVSHSTGHSQHNMLKTLTNSYK